MSELLRPWKLGTLAIGLSLLIAGSFYTPAPDWDIGVSVIMAGFTYLFAGWSMQVILGGRWREFPQMLLATWWSVDGCYALYWYAVNPAALEMMREANWPASLCLYLMCGGIWLYRGTLRELILDIRNAIKSSSKRY
jgi:hypothetical protein